MKTQETNSHIFGLMQETIFAFEIVTADGTIMRVKLVILSTYDKLSCQFTIFLVLILSTYHATTATNRVKIRQFWTGKEPGWAELSRPNRRRQLDISHEMCFNQRKSGNEVDSTIFCKLLVNIMLFSKLHCQKAFRLKHISDQSHLTEMIMSAFAEISQHLRNRMRKTGATTR